MGRRMKVAMITPGTFLIAGGRSSSIELLMEKLANLFQEEETDVFMFGKRFRKQPDYEIKGSIHFYRFQSSQNKPILTRPLRSCRK